VANPSVPLRDDSLAADVPRDVEVTRARTLEPDYRAKHAGWTARARGAASNVRNRALASAATLAGELLFPDPQVLWQPAAQWALLTRIAARRDDAILVSGPPFSQFLLAPLARAGGLGVVLDYRDEWWTLRHTYEMARTRVARALGDPVEAALLRRAHVVVTATNEFRERLLARFPWLLPERVVAIPNGYDPRDFPSPLPEPPRDRFVATYAGTVFAMMTARGLLGGLRRLHATDPALASHLRVRFVGRIVPTEAGAFEGSESLGVERVGYVPHAQVLPELAASHLALCMLEDVAGAESMYPAKIFELMYLRRPLLTLAPPESALARLVESHGMGTVVPPRDEHAIAEALRWRLRSFVRGENLLVPWRNAPWLPRYDLRALAGEFAEILNRAVSQATRRGS
jgi:hypothetical protein